MANAALGGHGGTAPKKPAAKKPAAKKPATHTSTPTSYSSSSAPVGTGSMVTPSLKWQDLAASYAWSASLVKSDPSLMKLFKDAVAQGWDANTFQAKLKTTSWYQTHSSAYRKAATLKASDPATWKQNVESQTQAILDAAGSLGAHISSAQAKKIATDALNLGWDEHQIQNQLASFVTEIAGTGHWGGESGQNEMQVRKVAAANGVQMDQKGVQRWVTSIARGDATVQDAEAFVRSQAALSFPQYEKQINAGMNVDQIASPFVQSMSTILELNPESIDLFDKTIRGALTHSDDKGQPAQMSLTDFEKSLRQDARWSKTNNARDAVSSNAMKVLKDWGFDGG